MRVKTLIDSVLATWPDTVDLTGIGLFMLISVGLPLIGYWLAYLDLMAYWRRLKGILMKLPDLVRPTTLPEWALKEETPPCLRALGLTFPCSEDDVKEAYREKAKELHPDRGGDVGRFLALQDHVEQAKHFIRQRNLS